MFDSLGDMFAGGADRTSEAVTNIYSARQAEENQRRGHSFSERAYKNRFQWTMRDLEKAGLNPILAGVSGAAGGAPSASSASGGNISSSAKSTFKPSSAKVNVEQAKTLKQQQKLLQSQTRKTNEETEKLHQQNTKSKPMAEFIDESGLANTAKSAGGAVNELQKKGQSLFDHILRAYEAGRGSAKDRSRMEKYDWFKSSVNPYKKSNSKPRRRQRSRK